MTGAGRCPSAARPPWAAARSRALAERVRGKRGELLGTANLAEGLVPLTGQNFPLLGLRSGADVICEKPLVLNPWNLDGLVEAEERSGRNVNTILQLRLHPTITALRDRVSASEGEKHDVELTYVTGRGLWYNYSWKGDDRKAGGIATNIGIHFFDMLNFVFGELQQSRERLVAAAHAAGRLFRARRPAGATNFLRLMCARGV